MTVRLSTSESLWSDPVDIFYEASWLLVGSSCPAESPPRGVRLRCSLFTPPCMYRCFEKYRAEDRMLLVYDCCVAQFPCLTGSLESMAPIWVEDVPYMMCH